MKRIIIPILMLCVGFASTVKAENTDLSVYDNVIYVASTSIEAGSNTTLSICMKNTAPIRGFQFRLYLPEGITAVKNSKGRIQASLSEDRRDEGDEHTMSVSEQNDGSLLFLCGSEYDESFVGTEGEIGTLSISVSADMHPGEYPVLLKAMKLTETDISKFYEIEQVETTITITATQDNRIILDEMSTTSPTSATNVDVRVKRTIKANEWSTICLPFAMTETQVKETFGEDVLLADFIGYDATEDDDKNVVGIKVNFEAVNAMEANHPYIIKVSTAITEFTVDAIDIVPENEPCVSFGWTTGRGSSAVYHPMDFIGTYVADFDFYHDAKRKALFLSGNQFYYATENTVNMKAFRAYFDFDDILMDVENPNSVKLWVNNDQEDGLQNIIESQDEMGATYNLAGQRVGKNYKGIVIERGKKTIK